MKRYSVVLATRDGNTWELWEGDDLREAWREEQKALAKHKRMYVAVYDDEQDGRPIDTEEELYGG